MPVRLSFGKTRVAAGILLRSDRIFAYFIEEKDYLLADLLNPGEGAAALVHSQKGFAPD